MKTRNTTKLLLLTLFALTVLSSCRSRRNLVSTLDGPNPEQARYETVVRNGAFAYDALQSKSKYTLGSTSLGGKLCLESGRRLCLQVNAPMLGFEIARVEATQEQVLVVDKYDKMYCTERLGDLYSIDELRGHEMEALECIVLGRIYIPGHGRATSRDYSRLLWSTPTLPDGTKGNSIGVYSGKDYSLRYDIDASGRLASTQLTVGSRSVVLEYDEYREVEKGQWVPTRETITATTTEGKSIKAALSLSNPEMGESTWRDFEPTSSYRKVSVDEMVNTVKALMK